MDDKFAVFITTHGRPDHQTTYKSLRKQGYTGRVFFIIDNEDETAGKYKELYGEQVIVFDKEAVSHHIDAGDNLTDRRAVVYARNAVFDIARDLGLDFFLELDDDYTSFVWKFTSSFVYKERPIKNLDRLFSALLEYYKSIDALSIAIAQNGDFIGGKKSHFASFVGAKRKVMNTFFCSRHRQFPFVGRMNDDVNTYVSLGNRGALFLTIMSAAIIQEQTQAVKGGMTELYMNEGTYRKSFYTVMYAPYCTKIFEIGYKHKRLHHHISWRNAVPCIINEKYCKNKMQKIQEG
jgi:hypothetical protein